MIVTAVTAVAASRATTPRAVLVRLALAATVAAWPAAAADRAPDAWQFEAFVDVFVPTTVSGTTTYPPSEGAGAISIDGSRILNGLNMAFIGGFEALRGRWGVYTHLLYMDLSNTKTGSRALEIHGQPLPAGVDATASYHVKGSYWTVAATYRAVTAPARPLDLLGGVRFLNTRNSLDWQLSGNDESFPPPDRSGHRSAGRTSGDGIVGIKGRFSRSGDGGWFIPYYADVGTGDASLTWQASTGVGYGWSWGDVMAGWRHLDYQMKPGGEIESFYFDGPTIIVLFRW